MKNKVLNFLKSWQVNRAVFFGFLSKVWGLLAGMITVFLIVLKFSPELQGYYYTFASLLALQVFAELGFGTVIIQFASHEWSKLHLDEKGFVRGDARALSRLSSVASLAMKWFMFAAAALALVLAVGGSCFFAFSAQTVVSWRAPWIVLSLVTAMNVILIPLWSLLEGCNEVSNVYAYRFFQSFVSNGVIWISLLMGAGIWTPVFSGAVVLFCAIGFFYLKYRNFFISLLACDPGSLRVDWFKEIFPMQWKIALSWVSGYFMTAFFTPVMFKFHGAVEAGRLGMTLNLITIIAAISSSWVLPRVPAFGMLIRQREFKELDSLFKNINKAVFVLSSLAAFFIYLAVSFVYVTGMSFAGRLLSPGPVALLLIATVLNGMSLPMGYYLIAHKEMPTLNVSVMAGLSTGISTLILGRYFGAAGIASGYLVVMLIAFLWTKGIWSRCRQLWHVQPNPLAESGGIS